MWQLGHLHGTLRDLDRVDELTTPLDRVTWPLGVWHTWFRWLTLLATAATMYDTFEGHGVTAAQTAVVGAIAYSGWRRVRPIVVYAHAGLAFAVVCVFLAVH